jgi:hypothetical protein
MYYDNLSLLYSISAIKSKPKDTIKRLKRWRIILIEIIIILRVL